MINPFVISILKTRFHFSCHFEKTNFKWNRRFENLWYYDNCCVMISVWRLMSFLTFFRRKNQVCFYNLGKIISKIKTVWLYFSRNFFLFQKMLFIKLRGWLFVEKEKRCQKRRRLETETREILLLMVKGVVVENIFRL